jgi:hypothetical protein
VWGDPKRPVVLAHLSDEAAARALSKHFGNFREAARELGVDHKDLRRLTCHNPAILDAAHERMSLFILIQRDEIISGLNSRRASDRRRAIDRMHANPALFGDLDHPLAPAARTRGPRRLVEGGGEAALEREAAAERASEREREQAIERELEAAAERERVEWRPSAAPTPSPPMSMARPWPAWVRRPTRGRGRR